MNSVKNVLLLILLSLSFLFTLNTVCAQGLNMKNSQDMINETATYAGVAGQEANVPLLAAKIIQALIGLVGVAFVILFIYGGFLYMTSSGNEERIKKSKDLLKNAVIGLIIIMAAYSIAYFISTLLESATI